MPFSTLGDNYAVSWNNLQDAVNNLYFKAAGTSIPVSDQCIYKGLGTLSSYVELDTANSSYVARATDQLLSKSELQPYCPYSFTVYYQNYGDGYCGYATKADACAHATGTTITLYCNTSSIAAGSRLYFLSGGRYYPFVCAYTAFGTQLWLFTTSASMPFVMTSTSSNTVSSTDTCSVPTYAINLYASLTATSGSKRLWYRIDGGSWIMSANNAVAGGSSTPAFALTGIATGAFIEAVISDSTTGPSSMYMTTTINVITTTTYSSGNYPASGTGYAISGYVVAGNKDIYCTGNTADFGTPP
jgi:hypothetical protein